MSKVLEWNKPKKAQPVEDWKTQSFDGGPDGGFIPNMDDEDRYKWKAKLTGQKLGFPQVEIRKSTQGGEMVIIVNLGKGYNYKGYRAEPDRWSRSTANKHIHIALNGPAIMTFEDFENMKLAIEEAKERLIADFGAYEAP